MYFRVLVFLIIIIQLTACEDIAILSAHKKHPVASTSQLSQQANQYFWNTLHLGRYDDIPVADKLLTAAYLENPNDPALAAHLGFLHIWKLTERGREKVIQPMIVNEIILAKKYFKDAVELNPNDARYLGFYADSNLVEGKIFHDERQQIRGYFALQRAIHAWPEFNYFTGGYVMSSLPIDDKLFQEGLEWQWKTLDLCAGKTINRQNPDFTPYMKRETKEGSQRACWNSWIAPHNFEGFFLNMGDMLVKSGDWQTAIKIYRNAQLSKNYKTWPYRHLLEKRIADAEKNVTPFRKDKVGMPEKAIMFNSGYGCVACHQQ